jgi:alkylation response protein AidB-like acyl-CoA dehydrogenase
MRFRRRQIPDGGTARRHAYVVNGRKTFITNGPDARTIIL